MAKLSDASKKLLQQRAAEVQRRTEERKKYLTGDKASYTHDHEAEAQRPVRKSESGRHGSNGEMLRGLGGVGDIKLNKKLKEAGAL